MVPWILLAAAVVFGIATFVELQRVKTRLAEETLRGRQLVLFQIYASSDAVIMLGDSITAFSSFPASISGKAIVNAGIGGATVADFGFALPAIAQARPSAVVVALGANDVLKSTVDFAERYAALLAALKPLTAKLVTVSLTPIDNLDVASANATIERAAARSDVQFLRLNTQNYKTVDGVHLDEASNKDREAQIENFVASLKN